MSDRLSAEVVICGAGIAGISAAYFLAARHHITDILLVDERDPLSLTSDKSTEGYRNWWPGPGDAMVAFMNRSIDILEELARQTGNTFHMNRRGYVYACANPERAQEMQQEAEESSKLGAGPLRKHTGRNGEPDYVPFTPEGFENQPNGADLVFDRALIREYFPYLATDTTAVLHVRRAGWLSAQQLGAYLLEQARSKGVRLLRDRVIGVDVDGDRVKAVRLNGDCLVQTSFFINSAGPFLREVGNFIGVELPVFCEVHRKIGFKDTLNVVPRDAPLIIWNDPQKLSWSDEERETLAESEDTRWMLEELPASAHMRPDGGLDSPVILMLWDYRSEVSDPVWPLPIDPYYEEIVLRGLSRMIPGLRAYIGKAPRPSLDGGYYTKTPENRPLIGPLPVQGAYVIGAFSGYGIMAACAAGELLAAHITGGALPPYAAAFSPERYANPAYVSSLADWGRTGQL